MRASRNYYQVLGVDELATLDEIKAAYRARAKELHPGKNRGRDTTSDFQELQEAFAVLGSSERRTLYDSGNIAAAVDPATPATEAEFDPVTCETCGCISAQPRYVQYDRVISALFVSYRNRPSGIFCPKCAAKRLAVNTFITTSVGWLGFWGLFWSFAGVLRNLAGGVRPAGINSFILAKQSSYFRHNGNLDLACALARDSISCYKKIATSDPDYPLGHSGYVAARAILAGIGENKTKLRSKWGWWPVPGRYALAGFAGPALFWFLIFQSNGFEAETQRTIISGENSPSLESQLRNYVPDSPAAAAAEVQYADLIGKDGKRYRVSLADYSRLKPIYDELQRRDLAIDLEDGRLVAMQRQLELERVNFQTRGAISVADLNARIDAYNLDAARLQSLNADYNKSVDAYNKELERVGRIAY